MNKNLLFSVKESELKTLLEVMYCTAKDETRPILQGVCFNGKNGQIETCGVDGYRLSKRTVLNTNDKDFNFRFNFILDSESISTLCKVPKKNNNIVNVYSVNDNIEFEFTGQDNKIINCSLLQGNFVNYNQIIPDEYELEIKIDAKKVHEAIKTIKKANEDHHIIKLNIQNDEIVIPYKLIEKEYSEEESLKAQHEQQNKYDSEWKLKHDKWVEKVNKAKEKRKSIKTKEPVRKIAKFEKVYIIIKEEDLKINIPCKIDKNNLDNNFQIAFNIKYISEAVKLYKGEITLKFNGSVKPGIITQDNKNLELILPIRLLNN